MELAELAEALLGEVPAFAEQPQGQAEEGGRLGGARPAAFRLAAQRSTHYECDQRFSGSEAKCREAETCSDGG